MSETYVIITYVVKQNTSCTGFHKQIFPSKSQVVTLNPKIRGSKGSIAGWYPLQEHYVLLPDLVWVFRATAAALTKNGQKTIGALRGQPQILKPVKITEKISKGEVIGEGG